MQGLQTETAAVSDTEKRAIFPASLGLYGVISSGSTKGAHLGFSPSLDYYPLPRQKESNGKISHLGKFFDFCPLRNRFCPLNASTKNVWCCHYSLDVITEVELYNLYTIFASSFVSLSVL